MVEKWICLSELGGTSWLLPVWGALEAAIGAGKVPQLDPEVRKKGQAIFIRLNMLNRIIARINKQSEKVYAIIKDHRQENIFTPQQEGRAMTIDNDLKYNLLVDIDSLLFELNSSCELITQFFEGLNRHAGKPIEKNQVGTYIRKILEDKEQDSNWFQMLDEHRNFFIHEGAPYVAVDISKEPTLYDLLIMKVQIQDFNDSTKFLRLSDINTILLGFQAAMPVIQSHLAGLFK